MAKLILINYQGEEAQFSHKKVDRPDRKDPLKREVRLASAKKTATTIAEQILEKNIKKGWDKYIKEA